MIRVNIMEPEFNRAYCNAHRALPVEHLELPRQYGQRWREKYKCRYDPNREDGADYMIFDCDEDYTWFILRWG
jgi:hypothetical protein